MKRKLVASLLAACTTVISVTTTASALPHVLFQDSHDWVASPMDITASGAYGWALPEISEAAAWEIIDGYPGGTDGAYAIAPTFGAERPITRAEFAKILAVSTGLVDGAKSTAPPFADVLVTDWFYPSVKALYHAGVIKESDRAGGTFSPNQAITRLDMAVWAGRAALAYGIPAAEADLAGFADGQQVPAQFRHDLAQSVSLGIIKGSLTADGSKYLYPAGTAKRVEATAMVMRTLNRFDQAKPNQAALETTVRAGIRAFMDQGKAVLPHHNPPQSFGHKYVEANVAAIRQALSPYFSDTMLTLIRDKREEFLPFNTGGGKLTWNAGGYTAMNDLLYWGSRGLNYPSVEITSVTPMKVLDRYAIVRVRMDVHRVFPGGLQWLQEQVFDLHLKQIGSQWVITQRTYVSEVRKEVIAP